jgi:AraC-like DNA-binding protein
MQTRQEDELAETAPDPEAAGAFLHWTSAFFPGLEFTTRSPHTHYYRHHVHDPLEITWVMSGTAHVAYRDRHWDLACGSGFLVAPREPHAGGARHGMPISFVTLHLPAELLPAIAGCRGLDLARLPVVATRAAVRPLLDTLADRMQQATSPGEQVEALADMLAGYLVSDTGTTLMPAPDEAGHPAVHQIRRMLDDAYEQEVPVAELADAVHLHERYLISLFKTATGIPPHQYLIARRLERARRMMDRHQSLCTVAAATGFTDQSHLTRHFKRTFGITPGAYQRDMGD